MIRFCPDCGTELKQEFKYCPSCGFNLHRISKEQTEEIVECENCGTENPVGTEVCSGCGIRLSGEAKTTVKKVIRQSQTQKARKKKKAEQVDDSPEVKEIDTKKIFSIVAVTLAVCLIILFAAGVFDKPASSSINTGVGQTQSSGVDLTSLQKINELEAAIKANPDNNEALLELAHLRNDSGMFEKAIENYREYLSRVPENADARIDMGVCYYNLSKYNEAIAEMTKALEYSPDHQIGHLNLGIVNLAAGNIEKSKEWLKKAVALGPGTDVGRRAQELLTSH